MQCIWPEDQAIDIDAARVRRLLRKLHARLGDIEEDVALRPSAYGGGGGRQQRPPRFTYSRRGDAAHVRSTRPQHQQQHAATAGPLMRSASLGALSDSEDAARQDPALWLTTPRKRMRRTGSQGGAPPFAQRLEALTAQREAQPANGGKALGLRSLVVQLGETLWLGRGAAPADAAARCRLLPLRLLAAFRLGEAVAREGAADLDYVDGIFAAVPPLLARFVLWHHVVALCMLRAPAYADALADALGCVGAFAQLDWLLARRLEAMREMRALVDPARVAPLHLRAVDIGADARFVGEMVGLLAAQHAAHGGDALWRLFVPTPASAAAATAAARPPRPRVGLDDDDDDTCFGGSSDPESDHDQSGDFGAAPPAGRGSARVRAAHTLAVSRYAKWVARMGCAAQSTLVLAEALAHALAFLAGLADSGRRVPADEAGLAVDAVRAICSLMFTRLGCRPTSAAADGVVPAGAWRAIDALTAFAARMERAGGGAGLSPAVRGAVATCATYRFGLVLLALLALRHRLTDAAGHDDADAEQARARLTRIARADLRRMCDAAGPGVAPSAVAVPAAFAARGGPEARLAALVLDAVVVPLAVAGASPPMFLDLARLVADALRCARVALAMANLVEARLDVIWDHHCECAAMQNDWAALQAAWSEALVEPPAAAAVPADAKPDAGADATPYRTAVRAQLSGLAADLQRRRDEQLARKHRPPARASLSAVSAFASAQSSAAAAAAAVQDDELGLLLTQSRRRSHNIR
ncbi:hypothetical protein GGI15_002402 [Coemansia interrupta]|uniref:Uncharacterized protein n=1 Tax=Coemansia interrupta TaxID=1126814 RepID=A0A9W8HKR5_9FUNG|nr:hypothetical protein GGI15_002402 [Coemansia interrupta]